jgi:Meiotically up-regulated gene 113
MIQRDLHSAMNKEDILKELRRTAKENGGVPLGHERFEKETGLKAYNWMSYWQKFSEALREAGFSPNKMVEGYKEEYLFEKFIELIRNIKRWPTRGDQLVKYKNSPKFPAPSTFEKFGTKQQFASKLFKYANDKKYSDITKISNVILSEYESKKGSVEEQSPANRIGSVYLVKSGRYYKIGCTDKMDRRHHEITIQLPEGIELIHEIRTDDPSGIEAYWHKRFESKRKNGEWFDLNSSEVRAFRLWKRII